MEHFKIFVLRALRRYRVLGVLPLVFILSLCYLLIFSGRPIELNEDSSNEAIEGSVSGDSSGKEVKKKDFAAVAGLDQHDPELIRYLREHHLTPPSEEDLNLESKQSFHGNGYSEFVYDKFRKHQETGYFVEAGAYDGEGASNSLYLEEQGWEGVLIECNPLLLPKLRAKNRNAWIADVCLSLSTTPQLLNFSTPIEWPASAKLGRPLNEKEMKDIGIDWMKNKTWLNYQLPCFPLYSILKAAQLPVVDFLSLDVQGAEIGVLESFPYDDFKIRMMMVEVNGFEEPDGKTRLTKFLQGKNYKMTQDFSSDNIFTLNGENLE